ncbi:MAG: MmcQ/YjbR family DNA-binding protein [Clostridia bacterium]|nr:MmcQ/YjbR family DNA-binding protein [Clostridia bacterium]
MNNERKSIIEYALSLPCTGADNPFEGDFDTTVLRHTDTGKWFGIIMNICGNKVGLDSDIRVDVLNVKCKPEDTFTAREISSGIIPAYHMNKKHWISVILNGTVELSLTEALIENSYELSAKKKGRTKK